MYNEMFSIVICIVSDRSYKLLYNSVVLDNFMLEYRSDYNAEWADTPMVLSVLVLQATKIKMLSLFRLQLTHSAKLKLEWGPCLWESGVVNLRQ